MKRTRPKGHSDPGWVEISWEEALDTVASRLSQVKTQLGLINLVGNAIKFTDAGEVAIEAEAHNGSFHVSVRDTGLGISSADQAKLFQEFQQADNAITRKKGGTGLGLAMQPTPRMRPRPPRRQPWRYRSYL